LRVNQYIITNRKWLQPYTPDSPQTHMLLAAEIFRTCPKAVQRKTCDKYAARSVSKTACEREKERERARERLRERDTTWSRAGPAVRQL